jgi:starch synthase
MKILYVASEVAPFVKVGGLADVAGSLPAALAAEGHDVRVAMPLYSTISQEQYGLQKVGEGFGIPVGYDFTGGAIFEGKINGYGGGPAIPIYFIQNQHFFERPKIYGYDDDGDRFAVFCHAVLQMLPRLNWKPDIIHTNDWHAALVQPLLKFFYKYDTYLQGIKTAFSIHNLAYQGILPESWLKQPMLDQWGIIWGDRDNMVNLMGRGIAYSDGVSTVSPTYAQQILTPEYGENLDWLLNYRWGHLWGILNGIDYAVYDPANDKRIPFAYDLERLEGRAKNKAALQQELGLTQDAKTPIIGMVSRLADQKGFDLMATAAEQILARGAQLVILGTGEYYYHDLLWHLADRNRGKMSVWLGFNLDVAQRIYAGSDFFLMPSKFEPCGLGQMIAMRYGSIPVVRHTGGLADTVHEYDPNNPESNGFLFGAYDAGHLVGAVERALNVYRQQPEVMRRLIEVNMRKDFSWTNAARQYLDFYRAEVLK